MFQLSYICQSKLQVDVTVDLVVSIQSLFGTFILGIHTGLNRETNKSLKNALK